MAANFESQDFTDEAVATMKQSGLAWLLFVGENPDYTGIYSDNLQQDQVAMLRKWLMTGEWNKLLNEHLTRWYDEEGNRRQEPS